MTQYVSPELEQDPGTIQRQIVDDLDDVGIIVRPATPVYYLIAVFAFLWAQLAEQASQVFNTIFRYYGQNIVRIPPLDAAQASTTITLTAADTNGPYLIPAGTEINLRGADGTPVPFRTITNATIPHGSTTVTPVTILAADGGTAGNDLTTVHSVTQTFTWAAEPFVTVLAATAGGADAEEDDQYQDRLADEFTLIARTLVTAENFEAAARGHAGIDRAIAIQRYNPGPPASSDAPGHITTAVIDSDGGPVGPSAQAEVLADFQANSLNNLIPHVMGATYTRVDVVFAGVAKAGFDPAEVKTGAEDAIRTLISPAQHGRAGEGENREWTDDPILRFQDVSTALNNTPGFDHWTALTLNGGTVDVALAGPAGLPAPDSTANGTVTA